MAANSKVSGPIESAIDPVQPLRLISCSELLARKPAGELVENVLPRSGLACVFGPSGAGKTFLVLDLAMAVARGLDQWFGHRLKMAPVIYIGLEGKEGLQKRLQAYQRHIGGPLPDSFLWCVDEPFILGHDSDSADRVAATIRKYGLSSPVVFLDTFSQATPGSDLNGPEGMGRAVAACHAVMRAMPGGLLALVHHATSKTDAGSSAYEMGHSSLRGALDASILVRVDRGNDDEPPHRCWELKKHKDAQTDKIEPFALKTIEVGRNEWGNPSTSCVVVPTSKEELAEEKRKAKNGIAVEFFKVLARAEVEGGKDWVGMKASECQRALAALGIKRKADQLEMLHSWTHTAVADGPVLVTDGRNNAKLHRINRGFNAPTEWQPFPPHSDKFKGEWHD